MTDKAETGDNPSVTTANEAAMDEQIAQLQEQLRAAEQKAEQQWDIAVRAKAEGENLRRRAERDVAQAHKFGAEKFAQSLLPVLDSLEQALAAVPEDQENQSTREGLSLTLKLFADALQKQAIMALNPIGEVFDPNQHEAMSMVDDPSAEPGTILQVIQKGFLLNERLLRPARVIVAKASSKPTTDETA